MQACPRAGGLKAKAAKRHWSLFKEVSQRKWESRLCEATEREEQVQVSSDSWMLGKLSVQGGRGRKGKSPNLFLTAPGKRQDSRLQLLELDSLWARAPIPSCSVYFTQ